MNKCLGPFTLKIKKSDVQTQSQLWARVPSPAGLKSSRVMCDQLSSFLADQLSPSILTYL